MITDALLRDTIEVVGSVKDVAMAPEALLEDVVLLAKVFPEEADFKAAAVSTVRAMELVRDRRVSSDELARAYEGWRSYHYQPRRQQGVKATMRLIYRVTDSGIEVKGFGHRYRPIDLYHRVLHDEVNR